MATTPSGSKSKQNKLISNQMQLQTKKSDLQILIESIAICKINGLNKIDVRLMFNFKKAKYGKLN